MYARPSQGRGLLQMSPGIELHPASYLEKFLCPATNRKLPGTHPSSARDGLRSPGEISSLWTDSTFVCSAGWQGPPNRCAPPSSPRTLASLLQSCRSKIVFCAGIGPHTETSHN